MVALLDKKEGQAVADILLEIADTYPEVSSVLKSSSSTCMYVYVCIFLCLLIFFVYFQSLYYPFKVSSSGFKFDKTPEGRKNRENVER